MNTSPANKHGKWNQQKASGEQKGQAATITDNNNTQQNNTSPANEQATHGKQHNKQQIYFYIYSIYKNIFRNL